MHCLCTIIHVLLAFYHVHLRRRRCPWELGSGFLEVDHSLLDERLCILCIDCLWGPNLN